MFGTSSTQLRDLLDTTAAIVLGSKRAEGGPKLWESSEMEQRCDAVFGVIRDEFGVSRQAVHS
jgi:hypothetical protein